MQIFDLSDFVAQLVEQLTLNCTLKSFIFIYNHLICR